MTDTEKSHPFPDRIIVSGPANEYPAELLQVVCELTIVREGSRYDVVEADGEPLDKKRPATREEIAASVELSPAMAHGLVLGCEVADPRFEVGDKIVPGPESEFHGEPGTGEILARLFAGRRRGWNYIVKFPASLPAIMFEERMVPVEHEGWQGTPPAAGTRRALVFDAICGAVRKRIAEKGRHDPFGERDEELALWLTDAIEEAFLSWERAPSLTDEPGHSAQSEGEAQPDDRVHALGLFASLFGGRR